MKEVGFGGDPRAGERCATDVERGVSRVAATLLTAIRDAVALVAIVSCLVRPASAATYTVTKTADTNGVCSVVDCSLREAVFASNASAIELDTIVLPPSGTPYSLTLGKLEITRDVIIQGAGRGLTVIDASGQQDKIFDVEFYDHVYISDLTLQNGTAPVGGGSNSVGGAIFNAGDLTLARVGVLDSHATFRGGGIYNDSGRLTLIDSVVSGNSAEAEGGGIIGGYTTLVRTYVFNNSAGGDGGGIMTGFSGTPLRVIDSFINGNSATGNGGGIHTGGVELVRSIVGSGNTATGNGAGLYVLGNSRIEDSTIQMNQADGHGGGLDVASEFADVEIVRSTFHGNQAGLSGGAINNIGGGVVTLTNSTLSTNTAADFGGAIHVNGEAAPATIDLVSSTLAANSASLGSGIFSFGPCIVKFHDTLVSDNCFHFGSTVNSTGGNLESPGGTCLLVHATDQTLVTAGDLKLDATLALNGGLTPNHALLSGSAAVDQGTAPCAAEDQRGLLRTDAVCDVGAYESGATIPNLIFRDDFESGDTTAWS